MSSAEKDDISDAALEIEHLGLALKFVYPSLNFSL